MKPLYILFDDVKIIVNMNNNDVQQKQFNDDVAENIIDLLYVKGLITRSEMEQAKA